MRVLVVSWAWRSHFFPLVPVCWALRAAGHEVLVATQPGLVDTVAAAGLPVTACGPDVDIARVVREQVGELEAVRSDRGWWDRVTARTRESVGIFVAPAAAMAGDTVALARAWRPDLVLYEQSSFAGPLAARVLGVPAVRHLWGPDVLSRFADLDEVNLAPLAARFGLDRVAPLGDLTLDPTPPSLQVPADHPRAPVRYVPYNGAGAAPGWADRPADRPRVCVTGGTSSVLLAGPDMDVVPLALTALAGLDVEVVAAVPAADRDAAAAAGRSAGLGADRLRVVTDVPLTLLLPRCDLLVHQGGAGTTLTALHHGLPQLFLAQLPEMVFNARQVDRAGAGTNLLRAETAAGRVTAAAVRLLRDPGPRAAAGRLRAEMAAQPTAHDVVGRLAALT